MKIKFLIIILFLFISPVSVFSQAGFYILDGDGTGSTAHVHRFSTAERNDHYGLLVLTRPFQNFNPEFHPFLNDTFGVAMNQNVTFSGSPELIFDGTDSGAWTSATIAGIWNFADGGKATITSANNNDEAQFTDSGGDHIDMDNFTALTGKIDLDIYNSVNNSMLIRNALTGDTAGTIINLNDFIDTGDFSEQSFVIPKSSFNLTGQVINRLHIVMERTAGTKPTVKFDDFQWEQTGSPATFKSTTPLGTRFHITELRLRIEDNIASTLADGTILGLDPSTILGVSALTNGIIFSRIENGKTLFSVNIRDLGDFLATGANIINPVALNTKTSITLLIQFPEPIVLRGNLDDFLSFTINDDLSPLTAFTAAARGAVEKEQN